MALTDFMLRVKINLALARDPQVSFFDINVQTNNGFVILTGDVDNEHEVIAAEDIVRSIDGVQGVQNELTFGVSKSREYYDRIAQRLLIKIEEEWSKLPDNNAQTQSDFLRWALWRIHNFRMPETLTEEERYFQELEAKERAFQQLSGMLGLPAVLLVWLMENQVAWGTSPPHTGPGRFNHAPVSAEDEPESFLENPTLQPAL